MKRLIEGQLDNLQFSLEQNRAGRDCVHGIRKTFKRIRALIRLARRDLGGKVYQSENTRLRDGARMFTTARDAQVLVTCFDKVAESVDGVVDEATLRHIHDQFARDSQNAAGRTMSQEVFDSVSNALREARFSVREWNLKCRVWTELLKGVSKTYRGARNAFRNAAAFASVSNLHEWRKQTKYLRHEMEHALLTRIRK